MFRKFNSKPYVTNGNSGVMVPSKQSEIPGILEVGTLRSEEIALNTVKSEISLKTLCGSRETWAAELMSQ